jgi:hypothetical protein
MNVESAVISSRSDGTQVMTFSIVLPKVIPSALEFERESRRVLNECGLALMEHGLSSFDTEGEEIRTGGRTYTSKGRQTQTYQTSFGAREINRHVYQHSGGGRTWVPLEDRARIIGLATPHFAQLVSGSLADNSGREAQRVFAEHHQRGISLGLIQQLAAETGRLALAKEKKWSYELETPPGEVGWIVLGIDGTCAPMCEGGWKQVMVGTITLCNKAGEPLETIYIANAPEDGKATFYDRMRREVAAVKARYPAARWAGISDGARDLRAFLEEHTEVLVLDFFHLAEYVNEAAKACYGDTEKASTWSSDALHTLKHDKGGACAVTAELKEWLDAPDGPQLTKLERATIERTVGYMEANEDRMDYPAALAAGYMIGSGVTEAACKTVVKARLCGSGMRWYENSMQQILCLRALRRSSNRWEQFWEKLDRHGC